MWTAGCCYCRRNKRQHDITGCVQHPGSVSTVMTSLSRNQTQPKKVKPLSQGHTAAAEPGLTPRGKATSDGVGPVTDLSPPGPPPSASAVPAASGHLPLTGQSAGLLIKLRFITATPRWRSCLPGGKARGDGTLATGDGPSRLAGWTPDSGHNFLSHEALCG